MVLIAKSAEIAFRKFTFRKFSEPRSLYEHLIAICFFISSPDDKNSILPCLQSISLFSLLPVSLANNTHRLISPAFRLFRFLKARNWDVKEAEKQLRGTIEWRRQYKPLTVDCRWCHDHPGYHSMVSFVGFILWIFT